MEKFEKPTTYLYCGLLDKSIKWEFSEIDDQTGSQLVEVAVIHFTFPTHFQSCIIQDDLSTSYFTDPKL